MLRKMQTTIVLPRTLLGQFKSTFIVQLADKQMHTPGINYTEQQF